MATVLHTHELVEPAIADPDGLAGDYEPTWEDWEDLRRHLEQEEARERQVPRDRLRADYRRAEEEADRTAELERIRRDDFNRARSAACRVRGIAACLGAYGSDGIARQLLAASDEVLNLVIKYA